MKKEHNVLIDSIMDKDNEITSKKLREALMEEFPDCVASERTVARVRVDIGWVRQTARYWQMVRNANERRELNGLRR